MNFKQFNKIYIDQPTCTYTYAKNVKNKKFTYT